MERLIDTIDSKFRYVLIVAKRAEQLIQGVAPRVKPRWAKPTRVAMDEVNADLIQWHMTAPAEPEPTPSLFE